MGDTITRAKGGTKEREVEVKLIEIPDLWHIGLDLQSQEKRHESKMVLECWHLAHDMLKHIQGDGMVDDE